MGPEFAFIPAIAIICGLALLWRRRRVEPGEVLQLFGGVPAAPSLPGLEYLYPGRKTPPDADVRETAVTALDQRPARPLPPGIKPTE